jgi:uncharacterized protein YndB with AHSA1/START domain
MKPEEQSIVIDRPIAEVFAFVTDQRNTPGWQAGLVEARPLTEGPLGVGSGYALVRKFMGRRMEATNEYTEFVTDRFVAFRTLSGPELQASYQFEPVAEGTKVTSRVLLRIPGVMRLMEPLVGRSLRREMQIALPALKALLESRQHAVPAATE